MTTPEWLYLKGMRGIRDGLHRDEITLDLTALAGDARLVALAGPIGRGKSTILDNLTPYLVMPSRVTGKLSGFSYYSEVYLPENVKDLIWRCPAGLRYRSEVIVRLGAKNTTTAYLYRQSGKRWLPYQAPDGTTSDGKTSTYERCLESIVGSVETFCASAFAAQFRRHLASYENSEAKHLLSDLLEHGKLRDLGRQAGEVVRLVRAGLQTLHQQRDAMAAAIAQTAAGATQVHAAEKQLAESERECAQRTTARSQAQNAVATLRAQLEHDHARAERQRALDLDREAALARHGRAQAEYARQDQRERARLASLDRRIAQRKAEHDRSVKLLGEQAQRHRELVRQGPRIERAARREALAARLVPLREARLRQAGATLEGLQEASAGLAVLREREQRVAEHTAAGALQADIQRRSLRAERDALAACLSQQEAVSRAGRRLPAAQERAMRWERTLQGQRERGDRLTRTENELALLGERLASVEREAGEHVLRTEALRQRFGLVDRVPCRGTTLQGKCELLGDARDAGQLVPGAAAKLDELALARQQLLRNRQLLTAKREALADAPLQTERAALCLQAARRRAEAVAARAGRASELQRAAATMSRVAQQLDGLEREQRSAAQREAAARRSIVAERGLLLQRVGAASSEQVAMALAEARAARCWAEVQLAAARERASELRARAARAADLALARAESRRIEAELHTLSGRPQGETAEEAAERGEIVAAIDVLARHRRDAQAGERAELARIDKAIAALPEAVDRTRLQAAQQALERAVAGVANAEAARDAARTAVLRARNSAEQLERQRAGQAALALRIAQVERQLVSWNLFGKCMGPDGVLALLIDDAGPALADKANELLLACYGPRYTLSIRTQLENGNGTAREGFQIQVFDADSPFPEPKPVTSLSGGQRVWINECLTRAVALHIADRGGLRHGTLFSDESDGALDPECKRMFIAMKRKVLELGGYEREFFISHTPELIRMADVVIDLAELFPVEHTQTVSQPLHKDTTCMPLNTD